MSDLPPIPGINPLLNQLPAKFAALRPWQIPAIMDILESYDSGVKVVVLDAPVGSGKTVIAEVVRLMLSTPGTYVAHNKDLQTQFAADFPYSEIMWGRANYTPTYSTVFPGTTCADCTTRTGQMVCELCETKESCPYVRAREVAAQSPIPVLNMAYWLNVARGKSPFCHRGLTIVDEADVLESVLMGQVSITIGPNQQRKYGIDPPSRMTKADDYAHWAKETSDCLMSVLRKLDASRGPSTVREHLAVAGLLSRVRKMGEGLEEGRVGWVYTGGAGSSRRVGEVIEFRPVEVAEFGREVWERDERFLLMSGSVVSVGMLLGGLGWEGDHRLVRVESQFHPRNRQVVVRPVADMTRKGQEDGSLYRARYGFTRILNNHREDRVLVHSVSYQLARDLASAVVNRPVFTYTNGQDRAEALEGFKRTPRAVLIAPSMDRGIDLPDDLCRVQIVVKVPYPNLGDKQISERLYRGRNGEAWYAVQVARSLMQMSGRAVRHQNDHAVTYVIDSAFGGWYRQWQWLFPKWWRTAVRFEEG